MGFSFTSVAVKGGARDTVLATLGLRGTSTHEEIPESDITSASFFRLVFVTANRGYPAFAEDVITE
jgi:hypothetical protein